MYIPYTGVGSRETPPEVLEQMKAIAARLASLGFTLRSGGAKGADTAFEIGAAIHPSPEIFLVDEVRYGHSRLRYTKVDLYEASLSVSTHHPKPQALREYARKLMARNMFQIRGCQALKDVQPLSDTPSLFLVCWTPDGSLNGQQVGQWSPTNKTGGTGQALRIAHADGIPTFNLQRENEMARLGKWMLEQPWPHLRIEKGKLVLTSQSG